MESVIVLTTEGSKEAGKIYAIRHEEGYMTESQHDLDPANDEDRGDAYRFLRESGALTLDLGCEKLGRQKILMPEDSAPDESINELLDIMGNKERKILNKAVFFLEVISLFHLLAYISVVGPAYLRPLVMRIQEIAQCSFAIWPLG